MRVQDQIVLVTGGAQGIGRALCERFATDGASHVIVVDRDEAGAANVAHRVGGTALPCDVADAAAVAALGAQVAAQFGALDLLCSNAGIFERDPDLTDAVSATDASWARCWAVNVMGHVHCARAFLPAMVARRRGAVLNTVSAAGLLSQIGSATYATTKHAALGFTEYLAITHRDDGIQVAALCPQGVATAMTQGASASEPAMLDGMLTPEAVADAVVDGLAEGRFLILPHPRVSEYMRRKTADYDRWLGGMAKLRKSSFL